MVAIWLRSISVRLSTLSNASYGKWNCIEIADDWTFFYDQNLLIDYNDESIILKINLDRQTCCYHWEITLHALYVSVGKYREKLASTFSIKKRDILMH